MNDIANDFTNRKDMCISAHNIEELTGITPGECAAKCITQEGTEKCMGIEYFRVTGKCMLSSSAVPNGCDNGKHKVDFYGNKCGEVDCSCDVSFFACAHHNALLLTLTAFCTLYLWSNAVRW